MIVLFEIDGWTIVKLDHFPDEASSLMLHNKCDTYTRYFKRTHDDLYKKHRCMKCWKVPPEGVQALVRLYDWRT